MNYRKILESRAKQLVRWNRAILQQQEKMPEGTLRMSGGKYFWRRKPSDRVGTYISKQNHKLIRNLIQKDYHQKVLLSVGKEWELVKQLLDLNPPEAIYTQLTEARRQWIQPIWLPDEEYIDQWLSNTYDPLPFYANDPYYYSERGEMMRSKSEVLIANQLYHEEIIYQYEKPLFVQGLGTVRPDFTILKLSDRQEIYWEHFGLMGNDEYRARAFEKINAYIRAGYIPGVNLIITFEDSSHPLDTRVVRKLIQECCR